MRLPDGPRFGPIVANGTHFQGDAPFAQQLDERGILEAAYAVADALCPKRVDRAADAGRSCRLPTMGHHVQSGNPSRGVDTGEELWRKPFFLATELKPHEKSGMSLT